MVSAVNISQPICFLEGLALLEALTVTLPLSDIRTADPQAQPELGALRAEAWGPNPCPCSPLNSRSVSIQVPAPHTWLSQRGIPVCFFSIDEMMALLMRNKDTRLWRFPCLRFLPSWGPIRQQHKETFLLSHWPKLSGNHLNTCSLSTGILKIKLNLQ